LLDVAIVSYRCEGLLRACLRSLEDHPPSVPLRTFVVDNASGDGTAEMVAREFPQVTLSVNERNAGFASAANMAIRQGDAPFALALNPDCAVREGTLDGLLGVMNDHPEVAICGPALVRPDGSPDHAAARGFPTPLSSLGHFTGVARRPRSPAGLRGYVARRDRGGPVDAVNGAFMLMRRAALDQVGLFDEGYWMYMEDLDLCYRMREAGWLTWYEPSAVAVHHKAGSSGPSRGLRLNYAFHRGMFRFYRQHYAADRSPATSVAVYLGIAVKLAVSSASHALRRLMRQPSDSRQP
jgi:N-acetylglucosaminyl-diphospho-decaprenol L-rhamnosyltransferase